MPIVNVDPGSGLNGTATTITVSGAPADEALTIAVGGVNHMVQTDSSGVGKLPHVFYGEEGQLIPIEVTTSELSRSKTATSSFRVAVPLEQLYKITITDNPSDEGGYALIIMLIRVFEITARGGSPTIEAPEPWINVEGELNPDGTFQAEGRGMAAGYTDIAVTFAGSMSMSEIHGEYIMGVEAGIPRGFSITYIINGVGTSQPACFKYTITAGMSPH